ncbi:MAG: helix-turn-helix transcriptional regulator [Clostridia bacterium]|nr:helix-turn-helix transcriptional regulator [Clostridia bacterium]
MKHITVGREFSKGKIAFCECVKEESLNNLSILNDCFCLLIISNGSAQFKVNDKQFTATAPCFVCFSEEAEPIVIKQSNLTCSAVYFHPKFLNVNMCFGLLRSGRYSDIAQNHDMFLLRPFIDNKYVVNIPTSLIDKILSIFDGMESELRIQRDWYWSCRSRSYFMEMIIALERLYSYMNYEGGDNSNTKPSNPKIKEALLYIEGNYMENITLHNISAVSGLNHTTLTQLFKTETNKTPMEYVTSYRMKIAKKHLAFTEIPIKDVAGRCGYKTVQHFGRVFKATTGMTPALFRKTAIAKRKEEIK